MNQLTSISTSSATSIATSSAATRMARRRLTLMRRPRSSWAPPPRPGWTSDSDSCVEKISFRSYIGPLAELYFHITMDLREFMNLLNWTNFNCNWLAGWNVSKFVMMVIFGPQNVTSNQGLAATSSELHGIRAALKTHAGWLNSQKIEHV